MPSFESLKMIDMCNLVKLGPKFFGIEEEDHDYCYLESSKKIVSFPNLENSSFICLMNSGMDWHESCRVGIGDSDSSYNATTPVLKHKLQWQF